eukprot:258260-Rhodomonas_salina.1
MGELMPPWSLCTSQGAGSCATLQARGQRLGGHDEDECEQCYVNVAELSVRKCYGNVVEVECERCFVGQDSK